KGYSAVVGAAYAAYAAGFAHVQGWSGGGGSTAYLTTAGGDNFVATTGYGEVTGAGYTVYAINFPHLVGQAGRANSRADLMDAAGTNTFTGTGSQGQLSASNYLVQITGFDPVLLHKQLGTTDTHTVANLSYVLGLDGAWL